MAEFILRKKASTHRSAFRNQISKHLKNFLYSINELNNVRLNIAVDDDGKSFWVLTVKVRDKIVADGINDSSFSMKKKGKYVDANK